MPDATITSTASTFGTISGTFLADQSTIAGTVAGTVVGTLSGSVGVPGPQGPTGPQGPEGPEGPPGEGGTWGSIVGTLSSQTDLQTALDGKYSTSNPSGYQTAAQVTSALSPYLTSSTASATYYPLSNPAGYITSSAIAGYATEGWVGTNFYPISGNPSGFLTSASLSGYATESWVTGQGYLTSSALTPYLLSSTAATTYYPLASNPAGYITSASLSGYAPLASPVFTGDPQAPTAALGDSDTSLATTAFVQQELASGVAVAKNLEVYVRNQTGSTIAAGAIVYINGATGNRPTITLAQANNDANSAQTFGFAKTSIANNGFGYVIVRGECEALDTSALTEGAQLYLSPTVAGAWTTTKPSAPQHLVYVGIVVRAHPTQGVILVAIQNGYELNEIHDVAIASVADKDLLTYESSSSLWKNKSFGTLGLATQSFVTSQGYITSAALSGYATESWVTSQGYITSSALTPYLTSATAASTYQTLSGMSSYLTTSAAASTYAPIATPTFTGLSTFSNPGNYALTIPSGTTGYYTSASSGTYSIYSDSVEVIRLGVGGVKYPDGVTQSVAYPGSSGFLLKADNLSGLANTATARTNLGLGTMAVETASNYLTTATAASTYQTISGMSSYLTTSAAASTYFTIANAANKADLASPTFTGVPLAPTASPGTNTQQIATTAFVRTDNNVKAWVNFNGTGTVAIRTSFNVTSVTDNGVGTYTVNFTNAITSNAIGVGMVSDDGTAYRGINLQGGIANITTTSYKINTFGSNVQQDPSVVQLAILR